MDKFYEKIMSILLNIITIGFHRMVEVQTQHEMTKEKCNKIKHVTFKEAKTWVDKHIDEIKANILSIQVGHKMYYGFEINNSSKYWASIVRFDGVGYLFNSWGLFKMRRYMNKILK